MREPFSVVITGVWKQVLNRGRCSYVLIGYDSTREEDLHRVMTLKSLGCDPYAMPYDKSDDYQRHFVRWVNRRQIFNTCTWEEYKKTVNFEQEEGVWV